MKEAENIIDAKEEIKRMIQVSILDDPFDRQQLIRFAKSMINDEVYELFSDADNKKIKMAIFGMEQYHTNLLALDNNLTNINLVLIHRNLKFFEDSTYQFIQAYSGAQHNANLGLRTQSHQTEIDKLFTMLDVNKQFKNSFGVTISPEMLLFAVGLVQRTTKKWDNLITIDAMPGTGKTTFDYALTTTMIDVYKTFYNIHVNFDINTHVIVTETREYCNELISKLPQYSLLMFIEAGNQFSSKKFYDDDQYELVNTVERIRFHGLTMNLEWNTIEGLDKTIRDRRATAVVSLEERGKAIVRGFNRNPGNRGLTQNPKTKNNIIISAEAASEILDVDALKALTIPIYPLPAAAEQQLDARKELGKKVISKRKREEQQFIDFLCTIPENAIRITSKTFFDYAIANHRKLSIHRLAQYISENIGKGRNQRLFIVESGDNLNVGYIPIDEYIRSFIAHLKSIKEVQSKGVET